MNAVCHRCGASLSGTDLFCAACGSPQVRFDPPEESPNAGAAASANPQPGRFRRPAQGISWRDAIHAALLTAAPSGLLSAVTFLSWGCCLWVGGGAAISVGIYRRRVPTPALSARAGLRIGAVTGLIAAYISISATAISRAFERFILHRGAVIDRFYEMVLQQSAALIQANPAAQAQWRSYLHFLLTPYGRATYVLMNSATASLGIIAVSAIGGALGVRLFAQRRKA